MPACDDGIHKCKSASEGLVVGHSCVLVYQDSRMECMHHAQQVA